LLTPEPPPACAFEVVIVSRISKTALDQVLAPSAIAPRGATVCLPKYIFESCRSQGSRAQVGARRLAPTR
jgi:hypothetical protein